MYEPRICRQPLATKGPESHSQPFTALAVQPTRPSQTFAWPVTSLVAKHGYLAFRKRDTRAIPESLPHATSSPLKAECSWEGDLDWKFKGSATPRKLRTPRELRGSWLLSGWAPTRKMAWAGSASVRTL